MRINPSSLLPATPKTLYIAPSLNKIIPFHEKLQAQKTYDLNRLQQNTNARLDSLDPRDWLRDYFIFAPSKNIHEIKNNDGINLEEVFINTPDGEKLHGYFIPSSVPTDKVMLYLHGNDENVSRWYLGPVNLQENIPANALIVDYRGYGKSTGTPSGKGVIQDALSMYKYLTDKGYKPENISLYGRSLGGGVALELATRVKVRSVIVQSSFSSLRELLKFQLPKLPFFLIKDDLFNSSKNIKKIKVPILISHGTNDNIVPLDHGYKLYKEANEPKQLIVLNGAGHKHLKEFYTKEYFDALNRLIT